jgi:hypothetical protein
MAKNLATDEEVLVPVGFTVIITSEATKVIAGTIVSGKELEKKLESEPTPEPEPAVASGTTGGIGKGTMIAIGAGALAAIGGIAVITGLGGDEESSCETVINSQGPCFLKVVNNLSTQIDVDLPYFGLSALMEPGACELYGHPDGTYRVSIFRRPSGPRRRVSFSVSDGETYTINVTEDFF